MATWTEALVLAGTLLTLIPVLRITFEMIGIAFRDKQVRRINNPDIKEIHGIWRNAAMRAIKEWNWFDQVCIAVGLLMQAGASGIRLIAALLGHPEH